MPPLNSYTRPYGLSGRAYKYVTDNDPWADVRAGGIHMQPRTKSGSAPTQFPPTPAAGPSKRRTRSSSNRRVKFANFEQDDLMGDAVPGFDGRAGGGKRRRPRKGNGKYPRGRKPRRVSRRKASRRKRNKKITAKKRQPRKTAILTNGVYRSEYSAGTVTSGGERAIYIGHSNMITQDMRTVFCYALVKNILQKCGVEVKSMSDPARGIEVDDTFTLTYRTSNVAAVTSTNVIVTDTAAAMSTYGDSFATFLAGLTSTEQVVMESIIFTPKLAATSTIPRMALTLRNAKVKFHMTSELRVQNETVIGTKVETTDVVAVDLIGKFYSGKGTGTSLLNDRDITTPFVASSLTGVISKAPGTAINAIVRPMDKQILSNCSKSGPFQMKAGSDILSVIKGMYTTQIDYLPRVFNLQGAPTYPLLKIGQYRMYGLEKKFYNATDQAVVRYTNRSNIGCSISYRKTRLTAVTNV